MVLDTLQRQLIKYLQTLEEGNTLPWQLTLIPLVPAQIDRVFWLAALAKRATCPFRKRKQAAFLDVC